MTVSTYALSDGKVKVLVEENGQLLSYLAQDADHALRMIADFFNQYLKI